MTDTGPVPGGAARLRETLVKEAIAKLSLSRLKAHLSQVALDSAATEQLVGHVRRANGLVLQRADPVREKRRDAFLEGLTTYLKQRCGDQAALALGGEAATVMTLRNLKFATGADPDGVEARRMVSEKVEAAQARGVMALTGVLGATAPAAVSKTLMHYRRKVRANRCRLTR